jgi:Zn-dependent protease with chaperone function
MPAVHIRRPSLVAIAVLSLVAGTTAQTRVAPPPNKYSLEDDVKAGREAAAEVERQMPLLRDDAVSSYVSDLGERLAQAIPQELEHPEFRYTFKVVNVKEINAFALPGGPMFVNRGMLQAAKSEGEVAGVMAHEMAHVALRHGTAQATKAQKYQIGSVAGQILGAIIGGRTGAVVAEGSRLGIGVSFLRFSRAYEKDADLLGAQIMARAGYDPVDMANMFRTIEQQGGAGGPEWLSDHPNPGNRVEYITAEARSLRVANPVRDTRSFQRVQSHLAQLSPARSTADVARRGGGEGPVGTSGMSERVEPPASRYETYTEGDVFRVSVPENWRELSSGSQSVWFAPEGAYAQNGQQSVFTHGIQFGVAQTDADTLDEATRQLVNVLAQGNQSLRQSGRASRTSFGGRDGRAIQLQNQSEVTGEPEGVAVYTTMLDQDTVFYAVGVAPGSEWRTYAPVFDRITRSTEIAR